MKNLIYAINVVLFASVLTILRTTDVDTKTIKTNVEVKQLESYKFKEIAQEATLIEEVIEEKVEQQEDAVIVEKKETKTEKQQEKTEEVSVEVPSVESVPEVKEEPIVEEVPKTDVLETMTGKMSGYGPDCRGCSGYTASGVFVGDGTITYNDKTYGEVRILAGDRSLKMGTIVRVKNSRAGSFIGIVLDRGGSIGIGKKFLFDLLYVSQEEALKDEVSYNVTFEILRYGY